MFHFRVRRSPASPGVVFIDSAKVAADEGVLRDLFPTHDVQVWYVHASNQTRLSRYVDRDLNTKIRVEELSKHDSALENRGILALIKAAGEVITTEGEMVDVKARVQQAIERLQRSTDRSTTTAAY